MTFMKTRMTELFGIKYPIMLAGMNWVTEPKLVSAVSNAGGLGVLATSRYAPEEARQSIKEVRNLTDKPFGVNIGLITPWAGELVQVAVEEKVPMLNYSLGRPWFIDQVHEYGGKVLGTVTTVRHAVRAEQLGVDAITVPTYEAAAHGSDTTSLVLIPLIDSEIKVPLVAAGGFYNGRGLAAALVLGADGISMGQRFLVTQESQVHERCKQVFLESTEQDILMSDVFDGMPGKVLRTKASEALMKRSRFPLKEAVSGVLEMKRTLKLSWWQVMRTVIRTRKSEEGVSPFQLARQAAQVQRFEKAVFDGDLEEGVVFGGQAVGGIKDIPTCQELIDRIMAEAEEVLRETRALLS
jgi:enoyl-[acyl-carrier protein] reductase II